jgi:hypothetical protein
MRSTALLLVLVAGCAAGPATERPAPPRSVEDGEEARCARGFAGDCRALGRARLLGEAPRDDRLAAALLLRACELGDPASCGDVAVLYALGRAVPQSDARAAALSRRACEQGAALACSNEGALLAEGAAAPGEGAADVAARAMRLFRTACDAGAPEGCLNLGAALEGGRLGHRDLAGAARGHRRACEAGLAVACHRLALLVSDRPDVAPDLTAAALEARACGAAVAPACIAANAQTPAPGARTPAARLADDRGAFALGIPGAGGFDPADLAPVAAPGRKRTSEEARRPPAALAAAAPPALRTRLGLDLPPRDGTAADPAIDLLLELRRSALGTCLAAPRTVTGAVELWATFLVDADGRAADVRVASAPADPGIEACAVERISEWEFPASPSGLAGPHAVRFAYDPAPPGGPPALVVPGGLRPALHDPGCVERSLRVPAGYSGAAASATVKLAVDASGKPGLVHPLTPLPDAVADALRAAVSRCAWSPGADPSGRPASLWTTLTVKIAPR